MMMEHLANIANIHVRDVQVQLIIVKVVVRYLRDIYLAPNAFVNLDFMI